jgi:membrane-bound metal-dependent hydrolase YbcI (DUF457 family)
VSWAAHELESYVLRDHLGVKISFLAILIGCLSPDMLSKLPVYGFHIGPFAMRPEHDPWAYHRGWVGAGPTHSLMFGVLIFIVVLWLTRSRAWALGLLIGQWAHALTDICDSVGTMLFFPFSQQHYTIGMWAYAAQQGKYGDADAYYSSLGGVWDVFWIALVLVSWKVLTREFFFTRVVPDDPAWAWLRRRFRLSNRAMLAIYRAYLCYGITRVIAWFTIARVRSKAPLDLHWGGPWWVTKAPSSWPGWGSFLLGAVQGIVLFGLFGYLLWRLIGRRLWSRAGEPDAPDGSVEAVPAPS